jgi:aspartate kinase
MLLSTGERIACALVAMAIHDLGEEAVSFTGSQAGILTDEAHTKAKITTIHPDRIRAALDDGKIVLVAGFQGVSPETKDVTTLGRGGSDATAVALAAALGAAWQPSPGGSLLAFQVPRCLDLYADFSAFAAANERMPRRAVTPA